MKGGLFVDASGNILGSHDGYPFYTIGQRKGLGGGFAQPMYVTNIIPESNTIVLGQADELLKNTMKVKEMNWMKYPGIKNGMECVTLVRYNDRGTLSEIHGTDEDVTVTFKANVRGIAPGQSAVFYEGNDVIGGGIIQRN